MSNEPVTGIELREKELMIVMVKLMNRTLEDVDSSDWASKFKVASQINILAAAASDFGWHYLAGQAIKRVAIMNKGSIKPMLIELPKWGSSERSATYAKKQPSKISALLRSTIHVKPLTLEPRYTLT